MADAPAPDTSQNWFRVCLNTIVRKGVALQSERLRILPMGSRVRVVETKERRVKIDQPIEGWCSLTSSNGDQILLQLDPADIGPTTPQMRSSKGRDLLESQMQDNKKDFAEKEKQKEQALNNPEIKRLFEDIQNIKKQLQKTEAQSIQLQQEQQKNLLQSKDIQENHLKMEEYELKIKKIMGDLASKEEQIQKQAQNAGVMNPVELQNDLDRLSKHNDVLSNEMEQNARILKQLQEEAKSIKNMMQQYVEVTSYDQKEVLPGDVLKLGGQFGMAVVDLVINETESGKTLYCCVFERPVSDAMVEFWDASWPKLCDGKPHLNAYKPNQCFFLPQEHDLCKSFLSGAQLLNKLTQLLEQMQLQNTDNKVE